MLLATEEGPLIMSRFEDEVQHGIEDPALAVRTRFFDDVILDATQDQSLRQTVLVAAGMDTRSYRLTWPQGTVLFELDRPELLRLKAELLADVVDATPNCAVRSVPVDLRRDWVTPLLSSGFQPLEPALWLVEGLLYFLSVDERNSLLKEITALSASGSWLMADYVSQTYLDSPSMHAWRNKMADSGHPWKSGCDDPEAVFAAHGWQPRIIAYGSPEADYGRWDSAVIGPDTPVTRGRYLVTAVLHRRSKV